jgi:hypothetical protein
VGAEIVNICGSLASEALGARSSGDDAGLKGGCLGDFGPGRAEEWTHGSEICQPVDQWLCRSMGRGLVYSTGCSFSKSWCRETFHNLGVQSADVSALWCFTSAKHVSSVSANSLVHGAHAICSCVPVVILDLSSINHINSKTRKNPCSENFETPCFSVCMGDGLERR